MTEFAIILTPLLVLPLVLLFRFVGCGKQLTLNEADPAPVPQPQPEPPIPYRDYILSLPDVIAYWRLVDDPAKHGAFAVDQNHFRDGEAREGHVLPNVNPTATVAGSEPRNPAHFTLGQNSLIESDLLVQCRFFDGGYVFVPYEPGLFSQEFTIEAWVKIDALALDYEHVLFDAGGTYAYPAGSPAAARGFRIYADRNNSWQVRMAPNPDVLFASPPLVSLAARTHVVLSVANKAAGSAEKIVKLHLDGKVAGTIVIASYNPPYEAPLFIGLENTRAAPTLTPTLLHPALFRIQEAVLYRKALSEQEIEKHFAINKKA